VALCEVDNGSFDLFFLSLYLLANSDGFDFDLRVDPLDAAWDTLAPAISCSTETSSGFVMLVALTAEVLVAAGRIGKRVGEVDREGGEVLVGEMGKRDIPYSQKGRGTGVACVGQYDAASRTSGPCC
jgi:hypothetical protein